MISFIVSAFNRPLHLRCCLASLAIQDVEMEVIVCCNSPISCPTSTVKRGVGNMIWSEVLKYNSGFTFANTSSQIPYTCYHDPARFHATGDWLCFPSEDSYYVPGFSRIMLKWAESNRWDFVYCDTLYDPRLAFDTQGIRDTYSVMNVAPSDGRIDKTSFIIRRSAFEKIGGWPPHEHDHRDGALAAKVVEMGIPYGKAPGVMVVHN